MQVWTKLTLGFATTAFVIVGCYGWHQLRQEQIDLRAAAERDLRQVGRTVQAAAAYALRDQQVGDLGQIALAVKARDASIHVVIFDSSGTRLAGSPGSAQAEKEIQQIVAEHPSGEVTVRFEGADQLSEIVGLFAIRGDAARRLGTLGLVRSLEDERRDLEAETRTTILSLASLVLGLAGAGWLLASVYVRAPLRELVQTMRTIRAGDMSAKSSLRRSDEIGVAATEFNAMMAELIEARQRLINEAEHREQLEVSLQRTDKLVTVGQLSAGLAHEIGSPLQVLNGRARALAARADVAPDVRRTAEILARESDRITRVVEQLLTFSRHTAPHINPAHLSAAIRDIVELFEPEARRCAVRLTFHSDADVPAALADQAQVQQVVMNLLLNAVRSTPPQGTVHVSLSQSSFVHADGRTVPAVAVIVADTGAGIGDDVLPRIFEPFFTTRSHTGGTGLGLAVVKAIVDAHGGKIAVDTRVHEGTRFTVLFPVATASVAGGRVA